MDKKCPVSGVIEQLSGKWTLHILRELERNGPKRFNGLQEGLKGISPRTLSARLKELEKSKIVSKKKFNETPPRVEYALTPKGRELIECFGLLNDWVKKHGAV